MGRWAVGLTYLWLLAVSNAFRPNPGSARLPKGPSERAMPNKKESPARLTPTNVTSDTAAESLGDGLHDEKIEAGISSMPAEDLLMCFQTDPLGPEV